MFKNIDENETTIQKNSIQNLIKKYINYVYNGKYCKESIDEIQEIFNVNIYKNATRYKFHIQIEHKLFDLYIFDFNMLTYNMPLYLSIAFNLNFNINIMSTQRVNITHNKLIGFKFEIYKKKFKYNKKITKYIAKKYKNILFLNGKFKTQLGNFKRNSRHDFYKV